MFFSLRPHSFSLSARTYVQYVLILSTTVQVAAHLLLYSPHNVLMHFTLLAFLPTFAMAVSLAQYAVHVGHSYRGT